MISIKTTTAVLMAVSSILGVAPIAALAQPGDQTQVAAIDDRDTNTQVNSATVVQTQGAGSGNFQASAVQQINNLEDNDANAIIQTNCEDNTAGVFC
jgi:hypothetical protein